ncbi:MAG: LysM peptidoglycan-binding domain-containing protein, partial [Cellvibrionaceae bacterium]
MISEIHTYLSTGFLQVFYRKVKVINILIVFLVISACSSSSSQAPVTTRNQPPSTKVASHVVSPGETLYSIAWRYGLDYKKLAKNNGIGRSYSIFPGQIINLAQAAKPISKPSLAPPPTVSPKAR